MQNSATKHCDYHHYDYLKQKFIIVHWECKVWFEWGGAKLFFCNLTNKNMNTNHTHSKIFHCIEHIALLYRNKMNSNWGMNWKEIFLQPSTWILYSMCRQKWGVKKSIFVVVDDSFCVGVSRNLTFHLLHF